jgi:glycerol-3-phosphate dehydrogenase
VMYWDGQFDDARLAMALCRTAAAAGAVLVNYLKADGLVHTQEGAAGLKVRGVRLRCRESKVAFEVRSRCVINATGVWVDGLRQADGQALQRPVRPMVAPSQGVHLVVPRRFSPGEHALMVPKTADGRVLFAVPWMGALILGTTDTPRSDVPREPRPLTHEVDFILKEAGRYLARAPTRADVLSAWVGLRPLVKPVDDGGERTQHLSREHTVLVSKSGLVTVTGGKWTTYRPMAEDVLQRCVRAGLLPSVGRDESPTAAHRLVGAPAPGAAQPGLTTAGGLHLYGTDARWLARLPGATLALGRAPGDADWLLTEAMVRFAARHEYARTVEDVLARRCRLLFVDARRAIQLAPTVAQILKSETQQDPALDAFVALARQYASVDALQEGA